MRVSSLLDTSVMIDLLRGDERAVAHVRSLTVVPHCSEVTRVDLIGLLRLGQTAAVERLFDTLHWVPVGEATSRLAGELGRLYLATHPLTAQDLIIAATAAHLGARLSTATPNRYPMLVGVSAAY
jgi:predicted nucleic acid-binding protein